MPGSDASTAEHWTNNGRTPAERAARAENWLERLRQALGDARLVQIVPADHESQVTFIRPIILVASSTPEGDPRFEQCEQLANELFGDPELEWAVHRKLPPATETMINHGQAGPQ